MAKTKVKPINPNAGFVKSKTDFMPFHIPSPVKVFTSNIGRSGVSNLLWEPPEWDLAVIGKIFDTESIFRRAVKVKLNLFLKEGYEFSGSNVERTRYINRRFQQMELATGLPLPVLMSRTIASLIRCSNAFWIKKRVKKASGGSVREDLNGKTLEPIAGYFLLPADTVRFKRDEYGKIKKVSQEVWGKELKEFNPEDVIHFSLNHREGRSVGTPDVIPVMDDIRALRRIEENVELLLHQHLFPLFQYQIGTEQAPAGVRPDGSDEIEYWSARIAEIPTDGCWVTPERHKVIPLETPTSPLPVEKVINHFKQRIYTGLGVSPVDMGEGGTANRSTAQTLSRNLIDDTKADQKEFGAQFYSYVIQELLLESTFSKQTILNEENKVYLKFKEIDIEARQAKENHITDLFLKNVVTHSEVRDVLGKEPFIGEGWPTGTRKTQMFTKGDGDWGSTNYGLIERDKIILQSLDEPGTDASKAEVKSRTISNKTKSSGGNSISNKNTPKNQHGSRTSAKVNKDSFFDALYNPISSLDVVFHQKMPTEYYFNLVKQDILKMIRDGRSVSSSTFEINLSVAFSEAKNRLLSLCKQAFRIGVMDTSAQIWQIPLFKADTKIETHITKYLNKLKKEIINHIDRNIIWNPLLKNENAIFIELIFDALEHRTRMIDNSEIMRAYNYGKVKGYGFLEINFERKGDSDCSICNNSTLSYYSSDAIIYEELPPFHPGCVCVMEGILSKE